MNESLIRDAAFKGSPIISYGQVSARKRWPKLLAFIAGSFGLVVIIFAVWFWFFTSIKIPADTVILAIIPAGTELPSGIPKIWKQAVDHNYPLPTAVGLTTHQNGKQFIPFAVTVFNTTNNSENWSIWGLTSEKELIGTLLKSPYQLYGNPWSDDGSSIWLSLKPAQVLGIDNSLELPAILQGYIKNNIWSVENVGEYPEVDFLNKQPWDTNFVTLSSDNNKYLANFTSLLGNQFNPPRGLMHWEFGDNLNIVYKAGSLDASSTRSGLAQGLGIFDTGNLLLPDQTLVQLLKAPVQASATSTDFEVININLPASTGFLIKDDQNHEFCPGQNLASFDEKSIENICSWSDICFVKLNHLSINRTEGSIHFCFD